MPGGEEKLVRSLEAGGRLEARQLPFDVGPGVLALGLGDAGEHLWSAPHESRPKRTQPATLGIRTGAETELNADIAEAGSGERIPDDAGGSEAKRARLTGQQRRKLRPAADIPTGMEKNSLRSGVPWARTTLGFDWRDDVLDVMASDDLDECMLRDEDDLASR